MSRPVLHALRLLLALVLCVQSSLAMAHCLRLVEPAPHQPFQVEICTPDGIILVDMGGPAPEHDHQSDHAGFCMACHGMAQAVLPTPPSLTLPGLPYTLQAPLPLHAAAPLVARAPPYRPTGPPTFL